MDFTPKPWSAFPEECFMYLMVMGFFQLFAFLAGSFIIVCLSPFRRGIFLDWVGRFAVFLAVLLVVGALFNGLWSRLIWGHLYLSTDYTIDFSPFWPITQGTIDARFAGATGRLLTVSLFQLQLIWLLFAAATWTGTIFSYKFVRNICSGRRPRLP